MTSSERRKLTDQELRRAAVFKRAWHAKKRAQRLSQSDAGDALDISPSAFGQYINGRIPIGLRAGLLLCAYLDVSPEEAGLGDDNALLAHLPSMLSPGETDGPPPDVETLVPKMRTVSAEELTYLVERFAPLADLNEEQRLRIVAAVARIQKPQGRGP